MEFKLNFPIQEQSFIELDHKGVLLGSCFAKEQAKQFHYNGMDVLSNPFGVLYNAASLFQIVLRASNQIEYKDSEYQETDGIYFHYQHHSDASGTQKKEAAILANRKNLELKQHLEQASFVVLTYGSSWVHMIKETLEIVGNCHKQPAKTFSKKMLSKEENKTFIANTIDAIEKLNPLVKVILSVSPVRHVKEGLVQNNRSKAAIHLAIQELIEERDRVMYFPAYEIVMDELRDYRFYAKDMVHPNQESIDYVWKRFMEVHFTEKGIKDIKRVDSFRKLENHRPQFKTEEHLQKVKESKLNLIQEYPYLKL